VSVFSSRGPASSISSTGPDVGFLVVCGGLVVLGSKLIVGIAQRRRAMLSQKGSQRFLLIVNAARVGPMKETMYDVELM